MYIATCSILITRRDNPSHCPYCSLQSECVALEEELGSRDSEEATRSRQEQAEANEAKLEKAREYWPQYVRTFAPPLISTYSDETKFRIIYIIPARACMLSFLLHCMLMHYR